MPIESVTDQGICRVSITDEMTIYTAAEYRKTLLAQFEDHDEMEVSLQAVNDLDSAGVQIMLMLNMEARRQHKSLRFVHHSPQVIEVLELLNLVSFFGDPIVFLAAEQSS